MKPKRVVIVHAHECEENDDGDLICPRCGGEYGECPCLGPHNAEDEGYRLEIEGDKLVGYLIEDN